MELGAGDLPNLHRVVIRVFDTDHAAAPTAVEKQPTTSSKNSYPRKPIQANVAIAPAAKPARGQMLWKSEIGWSVRGRTGITTTFAAAITMVVLFYR
jgi:hypothetical protein